MWYYQMGGKCCVVEDNGSLPVCVCDYVTCELTGVEKR